MSPWSMYGHDAQHSSRSAVPGPALPSLQWRYPLTGERVINFAPTVDADGTIYVGTWGDRRDGFFPGKLFALNADGSLKWRFVPPEPEQDSTGRCCIWGTVEASVAIGQDGTLYFGRGDNKLYALNPADGTLAWQFRTFPDGQPAAGGQVISSPVLGADGTIYFGTVPQFDEGVQALFAVRPDGTEKWRYPVTGEIFGAPALGHDGTIYVGDRNRTIHAVVDEGESYRVKWTYESAQADWYGAPAIGDDGTLYFPAADVTGFCRALGRLYALTDAGDHATEKWIFTAPLDEAAGIAEFHLALGANNAIYFSVASINNSQVLPCGSLTDRGALYALADEGDAATISWVYTSTAGSGISGAAVDGAGRVYVAVRGERRADRPGFVQALHAESGVALWSTPLTVTGEIWWSPPALGSAGTLYIGDAACTDTPNPLPCDLIPALYALHEEPQWDYQTYLPWIRGRK
ncbi:MAG: PQQ-binding-like beta-propeller repeat protein [Caldilineaceae bacterium]